MRPQIAVPPPGPASQALLARLGAVESPNITAPEAAIAWARAEGTAVWDADGNQYLDLTAAFGVAVLGHRPAVVQSALQGQMESLVHGMGDVHPSTVKIELLEKLAALAPGDLGVTILGCNGSDAIEAALKTALLRTGKPGVIAFQGGYHGLAGGALAVTSRSDFREPFAAHLPAAVQFVPYPDAYRCPPDLSEPEQLVTDCLAAVAVAMLDLETSGHPCGAVIVEPLLGRGGMVVPPAGFLPGLRDLCSAFGALLIVDEIYTGFGRAGAWFLCGEQEVVPDLLCVGKGMSGGMPVSACIGTPAAMAGWPPSTGEALHTSTFLGHPLSCAAALATLNALEAGDWPAQSLALGEQLGGWLLALKEQHACIGDVRGRGLMWGLDLVRDRAGKTPDGALAQRLMRRLLKSGLITLPCGPAGNVLALTPPLTIAADDLHWATEEIGRALADVV